MKTLGRPGDALSREILFVLSRNGKPFLQFGVILKGKLVELPSGLGLRKNRIVRQPVIRVAHNHLIARRDDPAH